jgi:sialic acid synthase SpsE
MVTKSRHPEIKIAGRLIGPQYCPIVIAEIGINHGGSLPVAMELVRSAKRAGAELVKHQTHIIDDEMTASAKSVIPGNAATSIYEIMAQCALSATEEQALKFYAESLGLIFISTPFSRAAADRLADLDVPAFKIGSGECNNFPLLEHIASFGKPVIMSTGMNDLETISEAVNIIESAKVPLALLHTTNIYPTPPHLVRLGALEQLRDSFPRLVFGLSDHTQNNLASFSALALGASIIERHYTDTMQREGPDIICSMDERECKTLISASDEIWRMRGGQKAPVSEETPTMAFAFATVCTITSVKSGELFSEENIWVKRPGTGGFPARQYRSILGKAATRDLPAGLHLSATDVRL